MWILIIMIWYASNSAAITSTEFTTKAACDYAAASVRDVWGASSRTVCVPK